MTSKALVSPDTRFVDLPEPLLLENGTTLPRVRIAFRTWGRPRNSAILICHALTGSADADEWWFGLFGAGKALDPDTDYIVCSNILGSCYGTTGPTSLRPGTDEPYGTRFPDVTIRDLVNAQARLLEVLGVEYLELVTGGSMGGMQALEWALLYPDRVRTIAPIATGAAQSAWAVAMSESQRQAIKADAEFKEGNYQTGAGPVDGLAAARSMAMISYRSPHNLQTRFGRDEADTGGYEVQSYLRYQGKKLVERFDANSYLTLIEAMDTHDVGRGRGSIATALASIVQPALVVKITSDGLYPPGEVGELAAMMPHAELEELDAPHGHDSFLIEMEQVNAHLRAFADRHVRRRASTV